MIFSAPPAFIVPAPLEDSEKDDFVSALKSFVAERVNVPADFIVVDPPAEVKLKAVPATKFISVPAFNVVDVPEVVDIALPAFIDIAVPAVAWKSPEEAVMAMLLPAFTVVLAPDVVVISLLASIDVELPDDFNDIAFAASIFIFAPDVKVISDPDPDVAEYPPFAKNVI